MKNPSFIASVFILAGAFMWAGCSTSTTSTPPSAPSGSLVVPTSINIGNARLGVCANPLLGAPRDTTISIQNTSTDTLRIHSATPQAGQFTVVSLDSVIPPSGYGPMLLQFCPGQLGNASATMVINSNAAQDSSLTVTLAGNGVPYTPGLSSQFTYTAFDIDTAGKTVGSAFTIVDSVIGTGLTYQGQSDVSETSDSEYFIIGTNGDDSIYAPGFMTYPTTVYFGGGWRQLPFTTQLPKVYSYSETYVNDSDGETITLNIQDTARYVDQATMMVGATPYTVSHVHLVESAVYSDTKGTNTVVVVSEIYFSSALATIINESKIDADVITVKATGKRDPATNLGSFKINLTSFKEY
jgi:hypothetical protein